MILAKTGEAFEALAIGAPPALVGQITVEVFDPTDGSTVLGSQITGITEPRPGTYVATLTVSTAGTYAVLWTLPAGGTAVEELVVGEEAVIPEPPTEVRPTLQMVADLVRTRIVEEGGEMIDGESGTPVDTFTDKTYPTANQAERLIDQAVHGLIAQVPGSIVEGIYPAAQHLAALYAAILIEGSYFREQLTDDQVDLYYQLLKSGIRGLGFEEENAAAAAGAGPGPVDSVIVRSVMTDPLELQWRLLMDGYVG